MNLEKNNLVYSENSNQLTITGEEIPQDNPDAKKKKKKLIQNILCENLLELIDERKINLATVVRETGIPFTTADDWANARSIPLTDENIAKLARYFNVTIDYLCFGIGSRNHYVIHEKLLDFYYTVTSNNPGIKKEFKEIVEVVEESA